MSGSAPVTAAAAAPAPAAFSVPIRVVEGPAGVTAWHVEDATAPVVSLSWGWTGGAALDPDGAEGAASVMAALLTEGAGDLAAGAFQDALRDEAISLSFGAGRDEFGGDLRALADALPTATRLARAAMLSPRFDAEAVARVRARAVAGARQSLESPSGVARRAFWAEAMPGSPYARPAGGTPESLAALPVEAIRAAHARQVRRGGLLVASSGAISAPALSDLLHALFGDLPPEAPAEAPAPPPFALRGRVEVVPVDAPQSSVVFGHDAIGPRDPDWEAAGVAIRVLGGGGFSSRLMEAVRVERGLAYGIGTGVETIAGRGVLTGSVATENGRVAETMEVLRAEWRRMAESGPTEEELADAVAYLTGSLPLSFTDTRRTAGMLLALRRNDRPLDWLDGRAARLAALTREGVAAVSRRLLDPAALGAVVAGRPVGL